MHRRRLASIARQLRGEHREPPAAAPAAADLSAEAEGGRSEALDAAQQQHVFEFVTRGVTVVGPEEHGLPIDHHSTIWDNLKAGQGGDGAGTRMTELVQMLNSPGLVSALDAIMGKDWAIVPFIHSGFGGSGNNDQTWCVYTESLAVTTWLIAWPGPRRDSRSSVAGAGTKTTTRITTRARCGTTAPCSWRSSTIRRR